MNTVSVRYIVVNPYGETIASKESMDDALDVLDAYKGFDEAEGLLGSGKGYKVYQQVIER